MICFGVPVFSSTYAVVRFVAPALVILVKSHPICHFPCRMKALCSCVSARIFSEKYLNWEAGRFFPPKISPRKQLISDLAAFVPVRAREGIPQKRGGRFEKTPSPAVSVISIKISQIYFCPRPRRPRTALVRRKQRRNRRERKHPRRRRLRERRCQPRG